MKINIFILIMLMGSSFMFAQKAITWEDLAKVEFSEKYFQAYDEYFLYPDFDQQLKALAGQEITISGYFLNIDPNEQIYILSKTPMASCFFCGVGGPETAVELQFNTKPSFKTDAVVAITGVLKLNADDVEHFNYILTNCKGQLKN